MAEYVVNWEYIPFIGLLLLGIGLVVFFFFAMTKGLFTRRKRQSKPPKVEHESVPKGRYDALARDKKRLEEQIKKLKNLKDVQVPEEQYKKIIAEKERLLAEISKLKRREDKLLEKTSDHEAVKEEYQRMRIRVKNIVENLAKVETLFNHFFSGLSIDIIFLLLERHPKRLSTTEIMKFTGKKRKEVHDTLKSLHRDKWLEKSMSKGFPRTNIWKLRDEKAELLQA